MTVDILGHMQEHARHAPAQGFAVANRWPVLRKEHDGLGRAHTEPVNPGEVGCDRPEVPAGTERAGYVTFGRCRRGIQ